MSNFIAPLAAAGLLMCSQVQAQAPQPPNGARQNTETRQIPERSGGLTIRERAMLHRDIERISRDVYRRPGERRPRL